MTKKHYIKELHKLCYELADYYRENGEEGINCTAILKILTNILGDDAHTLTYEECHRHEH